METASVVIMNKDARLAGDEEQRRLFLDLVGEACNRARIVFADESTDIPRVAQEAVESGSQMVVAGGGDGTVSAVASVLAGTETVLGVLPLGTLNHFAKDIGIPLDEEASVRTLARGRVERVDVGEVNGRVFVNNSSLGLYPEIIGFRKEKQRKGAAKWPAFIRGALRSLARYRLLKVRVVVDGTQLVRTTPLVFVGNNRYAIERFNLGSRARLDAGELSLVIPHYHRRLGLILYFLGALLGHEPRHGLDILETEGFRIESRHPFLQVSLDGELLTLATPLVYRIRPGALRVVVPRPEA